MKPRRIWTTVAVLLALIWAAVAIVMRKTDHLVSWPAKVIALVEETPWSNGSQVSAQIRQQHLNEVIINLNRLDAQQRRSLREDAQDSLDKFFTSLTEKEQKEYVDRTVEPYFERISKGLKLMPEEERKRLVGRIRNDLKNLRGNSADGERLSDQDREFMEFMIAEDPILFLREAPTRVKMELAPVLEEMQSRVQGMRR
ncbi:hypothetical protein EI77_03861 [Prosthecobacter fusiformis]|uniref:Uncharacterized protein n=1 Tax=Prosthecobacter fusiformis TaxID=48464 RepID=A0A4R7RLD9_9BACT|nr:hypothetical protein [Prosthecobacter fusiformis]TDU66124.1 hypothetical protein EI77_03861 [Prosthecobacter fusiformis]